MLLTCIVSVYASLSGPICLALSLLTNPPWPHHLVISSTSSSTYTSLPQSQLTPSIVLWLVPPRVLADDQEASTHSNWWHCSHAHCTYVHSCPLVNNVYSNAEYEHLLVLEAQARNTVMHIRRGQDA